MSPLIGFYCPDGDKVELDDCFKQCRMGSRCLTEPTLHLIGEEREWKGVASTTQLLNGTMLEFLKLTQPYYVDPDSRAFMLQGTKHHAELEAKARELGLPAEIPLSIDRDIFDLLEVINGELVLTDYKLWGSFKVAKALGIVQVGRQPDPSGEVYKTSGKWGKAGSPKMVPLFQAIPDQADNWEATLQLNRYRVMLKELGITLQKMRLQVTVRDGGLYIASNRGVFRNIYMIPIELLPDDYVESYFNVKGANLQRALGEQDWSDLCLPSETWDGIRCERYCDVWDYCPQGIIKHSGG